MFSLEDTFLRIKCVVSRGLQDKNTIKILDKKDYNKLLKLWEDLQQLDYDNNDIIKLIDIGEEVIIERSDYNE